MVEEARANADTGFTGPDTGVRLREEMRRQQISVRELAKRAGVDERTVKSAREGIGSPRLDSRLTIAKTLGVDLEDLWPGTGLRPGRDAPTMDVRVFPSRSHIPATFWRGVFESARRRIDICVYGGTFLFDAVPGFTRILTRASQRGVVIRFVSGDPESIAVHQRGNEEPIGGVSLAQRCRMTLSYLAPLADLDGFQARTQGTTLYASLFFADDTVYANTHFYGNGAGDNPVMELTREADADTFDMIQESFERIWGKATPARFDGHR